MKKIQAIFMLLAINLVVGCVSKVNSIKKDQTRVLSEDTGYLFMTIDTDINYSTIQISGPSEIKLSNPDYHNNKTYYLVPVRAGNYQLKKFSTFAGRFEFDEDRDAELWGFSVRPGVISYIGELKVRTYRYRYSSFELINNSSLALEYLEEKYPNILNNRAIEFHGPGKDFFFDLVSKEKQLSNLTSENK